MQTDPNQQVSQIEAKLAAGEIDCISIEPTTSDSTTAIVNKIMEQGIAALTVGVTSRGHEFTNFTQVPDLEGETAGKIVLDWMKANYKDLKVFAVSGGDPTQFWAQGRMKGFRETIAKAMPDAKFVTTEANGLNVSYDPGQTYDTYRAFLSANPDVQFIENVDIGAEHADRTIGSLNKAGQVYTIGWNVSKGQLDGIENKGERFTDSRAANSKPVCLPVELAAQFSITYISFTYLAGKKSGRPLEVGYSI